MIVTVEECDNYYYLINGVAVRIDDNGWELVNWDADEVLSGGCVTDIYEADDIPDEYPPDLKELIVNTFIAQTFYNIHASLEELADHIADKLTYQFLKRKAEEAWETARDHDPLDFGPD